MKKSIIYFILINLFFASFYLDTWHNANTTSRVLPVLSVVDLGTIKIDSFADKTIDKSVVNGHYYGDKAPLPSFIVMPFYALIKTMDFNQPSDFDSYSKPVFLLGSFICGSIPFVLICVVFFIYTSKHTHKARAALISMFFLYASFVFVFSGTFFSHVLSAALLLFAYILLKEKKIYFYSGLLLGLAFLTDYPIAFIGPIWAVQVLINQRNLKSVLQFIAGGMPSVLLLMLYNYIIMGSPFDSSYDHLAHKDFIEAGKPLGFSFPDIKALWGITFSLYRGLFIYCPFLLFSLFFFLRNKKFAEIKWGKSYLGIITVCYFLLISSYHMWWGGWSYGPRQLMPIAVLLLFESAIFISKKNISTYVLGSFFLISIAITWIVKSTVIYSVPTEIKNPFTEYFFKDLFKKEANPNNLLTMLYGINPWSAAFIWLILFLGFIFTLWFYKIKKTLVINQYKLFRNF